MKGGYYFNFLKNTFEITVKMDIYCCKIAKLREIMVKMDFFCRFSDNTVNALLVAAGTILFDPFEVQVLFKRAYYSRAATIATITSLN